MLAISMPMASSDSVAGSGTTAREAVTTATIFVLPDDIAAVDAVGFGIVRPGHIKGGVGRAVINEAV